MVAESTSATISSTCSPTSGPGTEEFHVLVKESRHNIILYWLLFIQMSINFLILYNLNISPISVIATTRLILRY